MNARRSPMRSAIVAAIVALACGGEPVAVPPAAPVTPQAAVVIDAAPPRAEGLAAAFNAADRCSARAVIAVPPG